MLRDTVAEMGHQIVGHFRRIDEPVDGGIGVKDGETERQRRVVDVVAAHVEQPGDRIRLSQNRRSDAVIGQFFRQILALVGAGTAGEAHFVRHHGRLRRRRLIGPHRIDRIGIDGDQFRAGLLAGLTQPLDPANAMQPGIVAERRTFAQVFLQPGWRRFLDQVVVAVKLGVGLGAHLQGVAPVDEKRRLIG